MQTRQLFFIDPLPNIAPLVRKSLTNLNDDKFKLIFEQPSSSIDVLLAQMIAATINHQDIALLAPFNETSNASLLAQYQRSTQHSVNSIDLLDEVLKQFYQVNESYRLPVIIPFPSIYSPEKIQTLLHQKQHINFSVACMSKHIIGALDNNLDKSRVDSIFYRHLNHPISGVNLMKDLV